MKYTCFISYPDLDEPDLLLFVEQLKNALTSELKYQLDKAVEVYVDKKKITPGMLFNPAIAAALCQSLCMVVVYMPPYETHQYCLREFAAMEKLEKQRKDLMKRADLNDKGMIIPIILRKRKKDLKDLPKQISGERQVFDLSQFALQAESLKRDKIYADEIRKIAEYIAEVQGIVDEAQADLCGGCDGFVLPAEDEVKPWREKPPALFPR